MASRRVPLDGPVVDLVIDLAFHGHEIGEPNFAPVVGGRWDTHDLNGIPGRVVLGKEELTVFLDSSGDAYDKLFHAMRTRNKAASLELADGTVIEAQLAQMKSLGSEAHIDLFRWTWGRSADARFWVGTLERNLPMGGNLTLREQAIGLRTHNSNFHLQGWYQWYVLPHREDGAHLVVIDTAGKAMDRERLVLDLLCLQFCFGTPLRLDRLVGLDRHRDVVAAVGLGHFLRRFGKRRAPVPDDIWETDVWPPELFRRMTLKIHDEGLEPLILAITSYLDAETDHLDGGYLKAQVGLEAFAKRLVTSEEPELLVKDEKAWKKWVRTLRPMIREHLKKHEPLEADSKDPTSKHAGLIYDKFVKAMHAPTGGLVQKAFGDNIPLPKEVLDEIKKRNYPAHGFLMNAKLEHDIDRDHRRLEMVQTLIAALVARHVGYEGPLKGYDVDADGGRPSPPWWPVGVASDDVGAMFVAERLLSGETASEREPR